MSPPRPRSAPSRSATEAAARVAVEIGRAVRDERARRRLTLRDLAARSGLSVAALQGVEVGRRASLETYARIAAALGLRLEASLVDPRRRSVLATSPRVADPVHAAMGELEAERFRRLGHQVLVDEPYQHFQFAGRADIVVLDRARRALLHVENKTRIADVQDLAGTFGAKRAYLGRVIAQRIGLPGGFTSETHVLAVLWTSEVLHQLRLRDATFRALCPDPADSFDAWWNGGPPVEGRTSVLVLVDPALTGESRARTWVAGDSIGVVRPRHRDYAALFGALRDAGRA